MTPLFRRIVSENRGVIGLIVFAFVANVAAYFVVVRPLEIKSSGAADRAAAAANALRAAQQAMTQAENLVKGKARADEQLDAFYTKVLPADMTAARRMTYASLPALARKTGVRYEARSTEVEAADRDGRLQRMAIRMVLEGDYASLRQFIYGLEVAPEFVIIDDVTLVEAEGTGTLQLTVDLSTYCRLVPNAS